MQRAVIMFDFKNRHSGDDDVPPQSWEVHEASQENEETSGSYHQWKGGCGRKYVESDPAYRSALLDVAAPLMGRPKDDLDSEDIRLHRKARRVVWAVAEFTVVLGLIAGGSIYLARQRQKIAASRALASAAATQVDDPSLALLL